MAILEPIVVGIIEEEFNRIAETVESEFKAEVHKNLKRPSISTGQAEGSIHIMRESSDRILVGSDDQHLNFLIRGNGNRPIYPKGKANGGANALKFRDGSLHGAASPYAGKPYILTNVANRHR